MAIANAIRDKEILENPQECRELVLDGQKIKNITIEDINFLEAFKNLETLSLNQTQLSTLHHLPPLKSLFSLELQDNKLSGAQCIHVICEKCPNLQSLLLAGNRFNDIQDFLPLQKLKDLEEIDVSMNPVVNDDEQIRASMFSMLPQLKVCNGRDREGNEVEFDDDEEGVEGSENIDEYEEDDDIDKKPLKQSNGDSLLSEFMKSTYNDDDDEEEDFNPESYSDSSDGEGHDEDDEDDEGDEADEADEESVAQDRNNIAEDEKILINSPSDRISRKRVRDRTSTQDSRDSGKKNKE